MKIVLESTLVFLGILLFTACGSSNARVPITYPALKASVPAQYTPEARSAGLQGTVHLYVQVEPDGTASHIEVLHSLGLGLDETAVEAVKQWRYSPATVGGKPVRIGHSAEVEFALDGSSLWRIRQAHNEGPLGPGMTSATEPVLIRYVAPSGNCEPAGAALSASLDIGSDGVPTNVRSEGGNQDEAVIQAINHWRYKPGEGNGQASRSRAKVEFACGPQPASGSEVYKVGPGISAPVAIFKPAPKYSIEALAARQQGAVLLALTVDEFGLAKDISVVTPLGKGLDEKAMEAVEEWRFQPGKKDGTPVAIRVMVNVVFKML